MAAELRAPDLPKPNQHHRWTTRDTIILRGETLAPAEPCSPQNTFSSRAPPRERAASELRRRPRPQLSSAIGTESDGCD